MSHRTVFAIACLLCASPAPAATVTWRTVSRADGKRWEIKARIPKIHDGAVARKADATISAVYQAQMVAFERAARTETRNPSYQMPQWAQDTVATVSLAQPDLVTAYIESYEFRGGAHGMTTYRGVNVGMVNGEARELRLEDLFAPGVPARRLMLDAIKESLRANPRAAWFKPDADPSFLPSDDSLVAQWVLTPTGITFLLEQYLAGPYAVGAFFVKIPYSEYEDQLDPNGPLSPLLKGR